MRVMYDALAAVARRFGLDRIQTDAAGFAELVFEDALPVFLRVADEYEIEFSARIPEFDGSVTPDLATALLRWNGRSDGARFALEPVGDGVVLGQRFDIRSGDDDALIDALTGFTLAVAAWRQSGASELVDSVVRHASAGFIAQPAGLRL